MARTILVAQMAVSGSSALTAAKRLLSDLGKETQVSDEFNPNVITEGDGRMEIRVEDNNRVFVRLVWDGARDHEVCFLLGPRDAIAIGETMKTAGSRIEESSKAHSMANAYEAAGNAVVAGMLRVEAANILERPLDWRPIHKPRIGPSTEDKPCVCVNCGKPSRDPLSCDFGEGEDRYCDQSLLKQGKNLDK